MNINQVKYFVAAYEQGGISTAIEALAHIMLKQGYYFNVVIS